MPRPGGRHVAEKPKDFFLTLKRIILKLNKWSYILIFALVLAMISAILALVAPNKLSDLADEIQKGIVPKTENIELITKEISKSFTEENLKNNIVKINSSTEIPAEDKITFNNTLQNLKSIEKESDAFILITTLPESILKNLLNEIEIEKTKISVEDQIEMFNLRNV